jgi:hypothetical protein
MLRAEVIMGKYYFTNYIFNIFSLPEPAAAAGLEP